MNPNDTPTPEDDPILRDTLKRCSSATYYAACKFRKSGRREDLRTVMLGVVERFVERELRPKLRTPDDTLRLSEDLGIDSLTMMEIVTIAEEVLRISVSNEELSHFRTLGEVLFFVEAKLASLGLIAQPTSSIGKTGDGYLAALGEQMRRIQANTPASFDRGAD